ncbi:MAG: guanine permease [Euryarchaeota archaeon]|nr:guanine permease [Euryarchaeota archaeon]MBJ29037.1 guanine permease [Euryarchaeota archaeon]|tara:strand:+ start:1426 stop:2841 length:1416 start_codon:yes stop_codon:yes gene_type:complete
MEVKQLDDYFGYTEKGSSLEGELRAGVTTFLTMAYILFVNPDMLSLGFMPEGTGIPFDDALFATAVAAFVGCVIMGLWANLPFALAPGMGLNAYFAFTIVLGDNGIGWEMALFAVFIEGILFLILSLPQVGARTAMINSIPTDLKIATGAGIGMFLAIIGLREMGWIVNDDATLVQLTHQLDGADHLNGEVWAMICLIAITAMMARGIKGAIVYGILGTTVLGGWILGASDPYNSVDSVTFDSAALFDVANFPEESFLAAFGDSGLGDLGDGVSYADFFMVMVAFLFVDIFDTAGTLYSVGRQAGYVDEETDELQNSDEAFMSDAGATIIGAAFGTSTTTTYIESAAGVEEGGKTGLVAVTVGVLMLSGLLLAGVFKQIPTFAAAPALVIIGAMMMRQAADIDWSDTTNSIPAFVTMVMMPFTYSIAAGIAWGIITYVLINALAGKHKEISMVMWGLAIAMILFYGNVTID